MNVILVISDSMRRDCLGCYGAPPWAQLFSTKIGRVHTPHLDRFAQQALIFDNAYIASFPTVPTRNDLLTGRFTWTYKPWEPLGPEPTLAAYLNEAGVLTGLVADTPHPFAPGYNYQRDFQSWELIRGQENDRWKAHPKEIDWPAARHKLRNPDKTVVQYLRNVSGRHREEDYFPARTFRAAANWLEHNHRQEPFFLYVDTFDPHEPWDPPEHYTDLYDPGYTGEKVIYPRYDLCDYLTEAELNHCRALYAGEATLVDYWFGHFLDRIASLGLLANTAVIFMSDHGFYLGEHGYIGKVIIRGDYRQSIPLYPEVARIPLLISFPGAEQGRRIDNWVQTVDLMPTICELLGVHVPDSVQARSFASLLMGRSMDHGEFAICSPTLSYPDLSRPHPTTRASIYSGEWLLVYGPQADLDETARSRGAESGGMVDSNLRTVRALEGAATAPALYKLATDPNANQNVLKAHANVARELHGRFVEILERSQVPERHLSYFRRL